MYRQELQYIMLHLWRHRPLFQHAAQLLNGPLPLLLLLLVLLLFALLIAAICCCCCRGTSRGLQEGALKLPHVLLKLCC